MYVNNKKMAKKAGNKYQRYNPGSKKPPNRIEDPP
jgi:hypothetical protein